MSLPPRPRRSVLFMPGSNARALAKAESLRADGFIFDLEDAVSPEAKELARNQVVEALRNRNYGPRERIVRVNALHTPWGSQDVAAVAKSGAEAVLLPKVETPQDVQQILSLLQANGAPSDLPVWCGLETPLGILHAEAIASCCPRSSVLVLGTSDLTKELHAAHTRDRLPQLVSLGLVLLAARAFGLGVLDGVHLDLADEDGFEAVCRQGRELGFDGKTLIHPKTIATANRIYGPTTQEIELAHKIVQAHNLARSEGKGMVVVEGKLIENLHVEGAHRTLALADALAALDKD